MPDPRRVNCQSCGKHRDEVGPISWSGKCLACAGKIQAENIVGIATMSGAPARRWREGMAASVGAVILDATRANP